MSRGGRGGGRAGATSGVRAVANALGIARHEMGAFTKVIVESQPTYPPVSQAVLPLEKSDELQYMAELRQELLTRFHESSFYLEAKEQSCEFRRYTDKYREIEREKLLPDWSRLPNELCWKRKDGDEPVQKKRKVIENGEEMAEKLSRLEESENKGNPEVEAQEAVDEGDDVSEKEGNNDENEEQEVLSDDDYQEEDNDYIHSYFDNGENYGEVGSDDNLDDDNAF